LVLPLLVVLVFPAWVTMVGKAPAQTVAEVVAAVRSVATLVVQLVALVEPVLLTP
jgi:hypothetical protein